MILLPLVSRMAEEIGTVLAKVSEWASAHLTLTKVIVLTGVAIGAFSLVVGGLLLTVALLGAALPGLAVLKRIYTLRTKLATLAARGFGLALRMAGLAARVFLLALRLAALIAWGLTLGITELALRAFGLALRIARLALRGFGLALRFAMGPVGVLILLLAALVTAGILVYKNWDTISEKAREIWGGIKTFFSTTLGLIVGLFKSNWAKILLIIFPAAGIGVLIWKHWGAIANVAEEIWTKVKETFRKGKDFVAEMLAGVGDAVAGAFTAGLNEVISGLNAALDVAARVVLKAKSMLDKVPFGLGGKLGNPLQALASALEKGIPQLQAGVRDFQGGLAVVGEGGPELVSLPRGSDVHPNGAMPSITVHVFLDSEELSSRALTFLGQALVNEEQVLGS